MLATVALVTLTVAVFVQLGRHSHPVERRTPWRDLTARDVVRLAREGVGVLNRLSARRRREQDADWLPRLDSNQ